MSADGLNFDLLKSGMQNLLRSKSAAGVEVVFRDNGAYTLSATILKTVKDNLEIVETKTLVEKISDLSLEPMVPVNLVLNGKGVVHKLVEAESDTEDAILLQQVLPNAKLDDFYLDKAPGTNGRYMVSILRKDRVDPVLEEFTKQGLYVVSAAFGPFLLHSVSSLLNIEEGDNWSIHIAGHNIEYQSGRIAAYQTEAASGSTVEIGGERIGEEAVIPFAAAFEFLFKNVDANATSAPAIATAREELKQRKLFEVGGWSVLGFFLIALMANFMLFSSYSDSHKVLESELFLSKDRIAYLSSLDQDVSTKQGLLKQLGLLTPARTSLYADAIAASVPRAVKLSGILVNPLKKKVKVGENPLFNSGSITIAGRSKKSTTLNDWVKLLKLLDWVKQVTVVDYQSTGGSSAGDFELELEIE